VDAVLVVGGMQRRTVNEGVGCALCRSKYDAF